MENYKSFEHKKCEYYPCHKEGQSCLFCYCPLYHMDCSRVGDPTFVKRGERFIKDCSQCEFPHEKENFSAMMQELVRCLDEPVQVHQKVKLKGEVTEILGDEVKVRLRNGQEVQTTMEFIEEGKW